MIDLHCHSSFSDGIYSPEKLMVLAEKIGLKVFSITDHDCLEGTKIAKMISKDHSFLYLTGIEISARFEGKKIEILGYNFNPDSVYLQQKLAYLQEKRKERIFKILEKLNELNLSISYEEVMAQVGKASSPGRPHFARALIKKGYVKSVNEAFEQLLAEGRPAYVKRETISPKEAIDLIHKAKGVAVLPHPLLIETSDMSRLTETLELLLSWNLDGIELYYNYRDMLNTISNENVQKTLDWLEKFCIKNDLLKTAGSDFHGDVGFLGDVFQPEKIEEEIISFLKK